VLEAANGSVSRQKRSLFGAHARPNESQVYDTVADMILDEAALEEAVSTWAHAIFMRYFEATEQAYAREIAWQKEIMTGRTRFRFDDGGGRTS